MAPWLNDFLVSPAAKKARVGAACGVAAFALLLFVPGIVSGASDLATKSKAKEVLVAKKAEALAKRAALLKKAEEQKEEEKAVFANAGGGVHSEEDVNYWRKQMRAFSEMRGVDLTITDRSVSNFDGATKIVVRVGKATPERIAATLDFLGMFGWLESYKDGVAVVHVT